VGLGADPLQQRPEDVLPLEEAVREDVHAGVFLQANEGGQVVGEGAVDRIGADAATVDATRRGNDLLRAGIDSVLIGKNVDLESLDEAYWRWSSARPSPLAISR
jgi:hypothetical protein